MRLSAGARLPPGTGNRVTLAVDRKQPHAIFANGAGHELTGDDQHLLVGNAISLPALIAARWAASSAPTSADITSSACGCVATAIAPSAP